LLRKGRKRHLRAGWDGCVDEVERTASRSSSGESSSRPDVHSQTSSFLSNMINTFDFALYRDCIMARKKEFGVCCQ
jgi:hypothetical protein